MNCRRLWRSAAACPRRLVFALVVILQVPCSSADRPNVVFVAVDDMRCDAGCYGHAEAQTPNIDRLAGSGVLFERAYCQQALCNPSRASLLSGLRPDTLEIWNLTRGLRDVRPEITTLPQLFRREGYHTQGIGKIFHNWRTKTKGDPASWSVPAELHFARHDDDQPMVTGELPEDRATAPRCHCLDVSDEAYFDGRIAGKAVAALKQRSVSRQPFFLAVGFWKPHLPFNAPQKYWDLYDRSSISLPVQPIRPIAAPEPAFHDSREIMRAVGDGGLTLAEVRELRHGYLAGVSFLDAQLGRVLDALDSEQLRKNTIVVFWSDHGFHLGENTLWCKTSNFERDARVPLLISVPESQNSGARCHTPVELLDLYPTLAELCGLSLPHEVDGVSLVPLLENPTETADRYAYTQHPRPAYYKDVPEVMGVSVRSERFRYTEWRKFDSGRVLARETYDYRDGMNESRNVFGQIDKDQQARLRQHLEQVFPRRPMAGK